MKRIFKRNLTTLTTPTKSTVIKAPKQNLEKIYQKKTPIEHVLLRPSMYVGSTNLIQESKFVLDLDSKSMVYKEVNYIPAIVKIFDEVITNASDNYIRNPDNMKTIEVNLLDKNEEYDFSVRNDGKGIPVQVHPKEKVYIPDMVFGYLLTGSNFSENSETGGRHGYGAKLTNIFSKKFKVETVDSDTKLRFNKIWHDNMKSLNECEITPLKPDENVQEYTKVSFSPDLTKFESLSKHENISRVQSYDKDTISLITTRIYEISGLLGPNVKIYLNNKLIENPNDVISLAEMYMISNDNNKPKFAVIKNKYDWDILVSTSSNELGFRGISFVNSISTSRGGVHLDCIVENICRYVSEQITSSDLPITMNDVKKNLFLFVNAKNCKDLEFDSQAKEKLVKIGGVGNNNNVKDSINEALKLSTANLKKILNETDLVDTIKEQVLQKLQRAIKKNTNSSTSKLLTIPKLEDATLAGKRKSNELTTLILTEGDSAKALAIAGLSIVGRELYGVYPLRGKPLNVRDASLNVFANNEEMRNLITILGLDLKTKYSFDLDTPLGLRYNRVMFMTDQDYDGSHIKGLLLNFFDKFWPELLKRPGFLCQFITPLIKAKPKNNNGKIYEFFSNEDYLKWKRTIVKELDQYKIKYYKGLGTSTSLEAREYFSNLDKHIIDFVPSAFIPSNEANNEGDSDLVDLAFARNRTEDRKKWLINYEANVKFFALDTNVENNNNNGEETEEGSNKRKKSNITRKTVVTYSDFIKKELIEFSWHDLERSIPSLVDGLKPSQRKVLYACFQKQNLEDEIKVAQLSGFVAENTAYHHGEVSLHNTIINMAQDFIGSNNIPLLMPIGQFGTRHQGGKDAASARYLYTKLHPYTRLIFPKEDDSLLIYKNEDGMKIEPIVYAPIIPLILVNGCNGIGTGYSTFIPSHHPIIIIDNVVKLINGEQNLLLMKPWFKKFKGRIVPRKNEPGDWCSFGKYERLSKNKLIITELPIGKWTEDFKLKLIDMVKDESIDSFTEKHNGENIHFEVNLKQERTSGKTKRLSSNKVKKTNLEQQQEEEDVYNTLFKLKSNISYCNMNLFNSSGKIKQFNSSEEILLDFFPTRLNVYKLRKKNIENNLTLQINKLTRELQIMNIIINGEVAILNRSHDVIVNELLKRNFAKQEVEYVLSKPLSDLTKDKLLSLNEKLKRITNELKVFNTKTIEMLWTHDLEKLRSELLKDDDFK